MSPLRRETYPDDWEEISLRIRKERARDQCECRGECGTGHRRRCPATQGRPHPRTGSEVVLTVAHLDRLTDDERRQMRDETRLRAMCQRCHLAFDREHHLEKARETRDRKQGQIPLL